MGRSSDAHALGDGVGDVEHLAHRLSQQRPHDAGNNDDRTGQGSNAAQLSGHIHADGGGHGLGQQDGILLTGQVQRQCQRQCAAKAHQRAHRDTRNDGGGVLFQQVDLFIQRNGQCHGGGQQQIVHRCRAGLVVRIRDAAHRQKDDHKDTAQQQRVKNGFACHLIDKGAQCKRGQRKQNAPCCGAGQKIIQQLRHCQPPFSCGRSGPAWSCLHSPSPAQ